MRRLSNPVLFTTAFGVSPDVLKTAGLIDPILNADTPLFIDPVLLKRSKNNIISADAASRLETHLRNLMRVAALSKKRMDAAWKGALKLLNLDEVPEVCLGYGVSSTSGSDRSEKIRNQIVATTCEVLELGIDDPEAIALMSFIEEGIGADTISDLTTNIIKPDLAAITEEFCRTNSVATEEFVIGAKGYDLPKNSFAKKRRAVLLVPKDIVEELPVAADWSDIDRVMKDNVELRERINEILADYAKATISEKKRAIREAAMKSAKDFIDVFGSALSQEADHYDWARDPKGFEVFREILRGVASNFPLFIAKPKRNDEAELRRVVGEIITHFKKLIEHNDLSELLWIGSEPRHEKAAQLTFFGIADSYCKSNNLDISPETNSGGGPVDFKFSRGYANRILVEIKLSTGRVVSGYTKQLEAYKEAAAPAHAILLVVRVGTLKQLNNKLKEVQRAADKQRAEGLKVSDVKVIDATRKPSASKR